MSHDKELEAWNKPQTSGQRMALFLAKSFLLEAAELGARFPKGGKYFDDKIADLLVKQQALLTKARIEELEAATAYMIASDKSRRYVKARLSTLKGEDDAIR